MKTSKVAIGLGTLALMAAVSALFALYGRRSETAPTPMEPKPPNSPPISQPGLNKPVSVAPPGPAQGAQQASPPMTLEQRCKSLTPEQWLKVTPQQLREWLTDAERKTLVGGKVPRMTEEERIRLLCWVGAPSKTEEESKEVGMLCAKYRLTRAEIVSLVGNSPVTNETCIAFPYGPSKALFLEFDQKGNLVEVRLAGQPPLWEASKSQPPNPAR